MWNALPASIIVDESLKNEYMIIKNEKNQSARTVNDRVVGVCL